MLNRREFIRKLTLTTGAVTAAPLFALAPERAAPRAEITTERELPEVIVALEGRLRANNGAFSWELHNELRHHYRSVDEDLSRHHADVILKHRIMDHYTLCTLSDWHLKHNNVEAGVTTLMRNAYQYDRYVHLFAACLIQAGLALRGAGQPNEATDLFQQVLDATRVPATVMPTLQPYRDIAAAYVRM